MVGKRCMLLRRMGGSRSGAHASDYAGMSNEKDGGNPSHRKSKVSQATVIGLGLVGPKARQKCVADG